MIFGSSKFFVKFDISSSSTFVGQYELKKFRTERVAELIVSVLPEFALKYSDLQNVPNQKWTTLLSKAAKMVYKTKSFLRRGEVGEILLHMLMRDYFGTEPAITKIYYKDSANDTVKGFDAVHVFGTNLQNLTLAIGESKIYKKPGRAISSLLKDFKSHLEKDFLRQEFIFIENKIDSQWPLADSLKELISNDRSLDEIFKNIQLFGLVAYDSDSLSKSELRDDGLITNLKNEISELLKKFILPTGLPQITITLLFVPLSNKKDLLVKFDEKLKGLQL